MAKQLGVIKMSGSLGEISFYKTRWGYFAKRKSSLSGKRVKKDDRFLRTMENAEEFTIAIQSGKVLRDAIRHLLKGASDSYLSARMNQLFLKIKKLDEVSVRGKRHAGIALQGMSAKELLRGFEFNAACGLTDVLKKKIEIAGHEMQVHGLHLLRDIKWPKGANGLEVKGCITDVDLVSGKFIRFNTDTVELFREQTTVNLDLTAGVLPVPVASRIYVVRCHFFQEKNGVKYFLRDKKCSALRVVEVV